MYNCLHQIPLWASCLLSDIGGQGQCREDHPRQVRLDCVGKKAEDETGNRKLSCRPPWTLFQFLPSGSCLRSLPWLPSMMDWKIEQTISSSSCFWWVISHRNRTFRSLLLSSTQLNLLIISTHAYPHTHNSLVPLLLHYSFLINCFTVYMERWLNKSDCLLLLKRTIVWFPAPTAETPPSCL